MKRTKNGDKRATLLSSKVHRRAIETIHAQQTFTGRNSQEVAYIDVSGGIQSGPRL